jgi:hypothetical protein
MANQGRLIATDIQRGWTPATEVNNIYQGGLMDISHAQWVVASAVVVFAPEYWNSIPAYYYVPILQEKGIMP